MSGVLYIPAAASVCFNRAVVVATRGHAWWARIMYVCADTSLPVASAICEIYRVRTSCSNLLRNSIPIYGVYKKELGIYLLNFVPWTINSTNIFGILLLVQIGALRKASGFLSMRPPARPPTSILEI